LATSDSPRRVLLVEDEASIRELVRLHLSLAGFELTEVADGTRALEIARTTPFDLILLDVMLPGLDGITVCRALRAQSANVRTPILMLTARDSESDKVVGLESGADDYVTKPFGIRELMARTSALLRRVERTETPHGRAARQVRSGPLVLDGDKRTAAVRDTPVTLTKQEFDLLFLLASYPGIVFGRDVLIAKVWGGDTFVTERTVDAVVSRLRHKIERDPQDPELILTAWGSGYKFADAG
jgi:DNA-binding response OmpR family regulator